jgi:hypothetical protein
LATVISVNSSTKIKRLLKRQTRVKCRHSFLSSATCHPHSSFLIHVLSFQTVHSLTHSLTHSHSHSHYLPTPSMNTKNTAVKRINADVKEIEKHPSWRYHAAPLEDDIFEWHFTIRGTRLTASLAHSLTHSRHCLTTSLPHSLTHPPMSTHTLPHPTHCPTHTHTHSHSHPHTRIPHDVINL